MKRAPTPSRFRLIDGVILAAIALLALKTLGLFAGRPQTAEQPSFARVISHARTNFELPEPTTTGSVSHGAPENKPAEAEPAPPKEAASPKPVSPTTEQLLLERLGERRQELLEKARAADEKQKLIEEQERRLEERVGKFQAIEDGKKAAAAARSETEAASLKSLVVMYETMKPKEAARVFERLPQDVLVPVVTQMNSRKMSEVLAAMSPESAEKLTVALAKRARGPAPEREPGLPAGELPAIDPPPPLGR